MADQEIKIFIAKIKHNPFFCFLLIPFIYKLSLDIFKKKILRKPKVKFNIPVNTNIEDLDFIPLEFINSYSSNKERFFIHFEKHTDLDKNDEQFEHYLQRFNEVIFSEIHQLTITFNKIQNWIETNPIQKGVAWHSYNVSERMVNWCIFLSRFHSNLTNSQKQIILGSLYQHGAFLYQNFEHHLGHHNHLINNSRGLLYACAIFKNHDFINPWKKKSFEVIETEIKHQILDDGVHAEQSSVYHLLLTRTFWELKQLYKILNEPFNYNGILKKMLSYFKCIIKSNNSVPFLGHITPDIHWKEIVGFGAVMIKNSTIKKSVYAQLFKSDFIIEEEISNVSIIFPKSGLGILKINSAEIYLSNDPRCQLFSHGDQNQLGIDISWFNTHLIRDSGLDSYNLNENRKWFESWQGQSCFTINNTDPIVSNWRRKQLPKYHYNANASIKSDNINTINANHNCLNRILKQTILSRKCQVFDDRILITDNVLNSDIVEYSAVFHFGSNIITHKNNELLITDSKMNNEFSFFIPDGLNWKLKSFPYAVAYGEKQIGTSILVNSLCATMENVFTYQIEKK